MFQKKPNLPARPSIPNKDEILEDLNSSSLDDIVYLSSAQQSLSFDEFNCTRETEISPQVELSDSNKAYIKVASFVEKMNHLEKCILELQKKKESLIESEQSLRLDMIKVEKELKKQSESGNKN